MTAAGEALARRARSVLAEIAEAGREIGDVAEGRMGSVRLGAVTAPAVELVVPVLQRLQRQYPGLQAQVDVATSDVLLPDLMRGRHDFVIGRVPGRHRRAAVRACAASRRSRLALIVRAGHPLARARSVSAADLAPYDWVMQPPGSLLRTTARGGADRARRAAAELPAQHRLAPGDAGAGQPLERHRPGIGRGGAAGGRATAASGGG